MIKGPKKIKTKLKPKGSKTQIPLTSLPNEKRKIIKKTLRAKIQLQKLLINEELAYFNIPLHKLGDQNDDVQLQHILFKAKNT